MGMPAVINLKDTEPDVKIERDDDGSTVLVVATEHVTFRVNVGLTLGSAARLVAGLETAAAENGDADILADWQGQAVTRDGDDLKEGDDVVSDLFAGTGHVERVRAGRAGVVVTVVSVRMDTGTVTEMDPEDLHKVAEDAPPKEPVPEEAATAAAGGSAGHAVKVTAVDFATPGHYGTGPRFPSWKEAVDHARETIKRFEYPGQAVCTDDLYYHPLSHVQEGGTLVHYSRAFVEMRVMEPVQDRPGSDVQYGSDRPAFIWEVFHDGTAETRPEPRI
jgi:hypothetical protein